MRSFMVRAIAGIASLLVVSATEACPVCSSPTGQDVRRGIFDPAFASNAAAIGLPFAVAIGVAGFLVPRMLPPGDGARAQDSQGRRSENR